ncbi:hypothetical protein SDC9_69861 [bioreactor metagenome]|uniref:Uncharacterized protein n=1 Tax=bioreactor metagenome TaxID=1076179 RepID=A0A644Y4Z9_9ZZZZ
MVAVHGLARGLKRGKTRVHHPAAQLFDQIAFFAGEDIGVPARVAEQPEEDFLGQRLDVDRIVQSNREGIVAAVDRQLDAVVVEQVVEFAFAPVGRTARKHFGQQRADAVVGFAFPDRTGGQQQYVIVQRQRAAGHNRRFRAGSKPGGALDRIGQRRRGGSGAADGGFGRRQHRPRKRFRLQVFRRGLIDFVQSQCLQPRQIMAGMIGRAVVEHPVIDHRDGFARRFQRPVEMRALLEFFAFELGLGHAILAHILENPADARFQRGQFGRLAGGIDAEDSGEGAGVTRGAHGDGQLFLLPQLSHQPRAAVLADDSGQYVERRNIAVRGRRRLDAERDPGHRIGEFGPQNAFELLLRLRHHHRLGQIAAGKIRQAFIEQRCCRVGIDRACDQPVHPHAAIALAIVIGHYRAADVGDLVGEADDRKTGRMDGENLLPEVLDQNLFGTVENHFGFACDHRFFGDEFFFRKRRFGKHRAQDVDAVDQFLGREFDIIGGVVEGGVGVALAAEFVHPVGGAVARIARTTLEQHMFEKVRYAAAGIFAFMDAAGADDRLDQGQRQRFVVQYIKHGTARQRTDGYRQQRRKINQFSEPSIHLTAPPRRAVRSD